MKNALRRGSALLWGCLLVSALLLLPTTRAKANDVMGEIQLEGRSNIERTSGVWVDGQYVGYLKELKGSKQIMLLPGEHVVSVRQDGYQDFTQRVLVQPGGKDVILVAMQRDPREPLPNVTATVKISANPSRAAVFVDGLFVGHVAEFEGHRRGMLVAPGAHQIRIALPGYEPFEADIKPLPNQKVEIKTELVKSNGPPIEPLVEKETRAAGPPSVVTREATAKAVVP